MRSEAPGQKACDATLSAEYSDHVGSCCSLVLTSMVVDKRSLTKIHDTTGLNSKPFGRQGPIIRISSMDIFDMFETTSEYYMYYQTQSQAVECTSSQQINQVNCWMKTGKKPSSWCRSSYFHGYVQHLDMDISMVFQPLERLILLAR